MGRWIKACESALVDLVNSGPPDHDQTHVLNSESSIALVKSDGCVMRSNNGNKREVEPALGDHGPLIACDVTSSWLFKLP